MKWTTSISPLIKEIELRKQPVIIRINKFDEESAAKFQLEIAQAHNTGQKVIPVVIDSYGGQVYALMTMISAIKHSEIPVATIVEGKAMSCGAVLFTFGETGLRYMDPDATLMIHDVSSMDWGKVEELKAGATEADRLNEKIYTMMARNCGKKDDYFLKIVDKKKHADWFIDSAQAKKHHLANHLRVPKFNVTVGVDIDFE
jgi:ATP-dependent Clp protease protease subunit